MKCHYVKVGETSKGFEYACSNMGCGHKRISRNPPSKLHRQCDGVDVSLNATLASIKANGPTRTDAEVLYIIANHCSWCPNWIPTAKKKKCKACGCGSTETVDSLHRRRIKNCPRQNEPAAWTEQMLQSRMRNDSPGKPQTSNPDSA